MTKQIILDKSLGLFQEGSNVFVSSLALAKMFDKEHKNVLRDIRNEIIMLEDVLTEGQDESRPSKLSHEIKSGGSKLSRAIKIKQYFILTKYLKNGKQNTQYSLTKKGFQQIALKFTGKKASLNRFNYIEKFEELENAIRGNKELSKTHNMDGYWSGVRNQGKIDRRRLTDAIQKYIVDYRMNVENKKNDGRYFVHYSNLLNKHLGIMVTIDPNTRDKEEVRMLTKLGMYEDAITDKIIQYHNEGMHYKEAYKLIKANVATLI